MCGQAGGPGSTSLVNGALDPVAYLSHTVVIGCMAFQLPPSGQQSPGEPAILQLAKQAAQRHVADLTQRTDATLAKLSQILDSAANVLR